MTSWGHEDRQVGLAASQALVLAATGTGGQTDGHVRMAVVEGREDADRHVPHGRWRRGCAQGPVLPSARTALLPGTLLMRSGGRPAGTDFGDDDKRAVRLRQSLTPEAEYSMPTTSLSNPSHPTEATNR